MSLTYRFNHLQIVLDALQPGSHENLYILWQIGRIKLCTENTLKLTPMEVEKLKLLIEQLIELAICAIGT